MLVSVSFSVFSLITVIPGPYKRRFACILAPGTFDREKKNEVGGLTYHDYLYLFIECYSKLIEL